MGCSRPRPSTLANAPPKSLWVKHAPFKFCLARSNGRLFGSWPETEDAKMKFSGGGGCTFVCFDDCLRFKFMYHLCIIYIDFEISTPSVLLQ